MNNPQITRIPIAKTGMLVRKPVEHVFEAIVNPDITTKFWFSKGSGRLETGKAAKWDWESHDVSIEVTPKVVEPNKRVVIEWPGYSGPTTVEWTFQSIPDGTTFVRVQESGWTGDADKLMRYVADSTQGFTLLLAGLKAWLEHGIQLNLTLDRYPKGIEDQQFE
ncbi:SRPBCC family protein [Neorhizobium sp. T25_13]|uniref:SRPBCC family protein n=1 Tax=Neorhizobium sp. T25_13 TaxID=2093830 RepID=UPI000CF9C8AF|nr:SRPBCC family protein [Neorhizobium sp. T25_13]